MSDVENHTLALSREMRAEMKRDRDAVLAEIRAFGSRTNDRLDTMQTRLDALHQNGIKALKGFVGHRGMVERTVASFGIDVSALRRRVEALEAVQS